MNQNIEVINEYLWAVKFSLIPYISEIKYTPAPGTKVEDDFGFITEQRLLILNKEYRHYKMLKDIMKKLIRMPTKRLKNELIKYSNMKNKDWSKTIYKIMIPIELRRREED